jgi:hypothetical protein
MNDASQRGVFAIFAILAVSGGVAYAAASGRLPNASRGAAQAIRAQPIQTAPAERIDARAGYAFALDADAGCARGRRVKIRDGSDASVRVLSDCD